MEEQTMRRSRFTKEEIIAILRGQESDVATADICRRHGVSKWRHPTSNFFDKLTRLKGTAVPRDKTNISLAATTCPEQAMINSR